MKLNIFTHIFWKFKEKYSLIFDQSTKISPLKKLHMSLVEHFNCVSTSECVQVKLHPLKQIILPMGTSRVHNYCYH
jgi:hypothetical protein